MSAWFGTEDPFVDESKKLERTNYYKENYDIVPEVGTYEGKHTFDSNILASEIARLEQLTLKR